MATLGALVGLAIGGFGKKPKIPQLPKIDPTQIQQETIAGNAQQLPALEGLASNVNRINAQQALGQFEQLLPGQLEQARSVVSSQLRGEIPTDVAGLIERRATATSVGLGVGGSGIHSNITARDLGLTSLQIQQQGLSNFGNLANLTRPPLFDVGSMFLSPAQRLNFAMGNRESQFNRDLLAAQVKAAPDPGMAALTQAIMTDETAILQAIGNIGGMAAGACWVARAVYGEHDIRWRVFRTWLLHDAPSSLRRFYLHYGERLALWLKDHKLMLFLVRCWMDRIVKRKLWPIN